MVLGRSALIVLCHGTHTKANRIDVMLDRRTRSWDLHKARELMKKAGVFVEIDGPNKDGSEPDTPLFESDELRDTVFKTAVNGRRIFTGLGEEPKVYAMNTLHAFELELRQMDYLDEGDRRSRSSNAVAILRHHIRPKSWSHGRRKPLCFKQCCRLASIQTGPISQQTIQTVKEDYYRACGKDGIVISGSRRHYRDSGNVKDMVDPQKVGRRYEAWRPSDGRIRAR